MSDLKINLGDKKLNIDQGGRPWVNAHRIIVNEEKFALSHFLADASVDGEGHITFEDLGQSKIGKWLIPLREIREFEQAVIQLEQLKDDPQIDPARRKFLQAFRFPNPDLADLAEYPIRLLDGKLIFLWGYEEKEQPGSNVPNTITPIQMYERLVHRAFPPNLPNRMYAFLAVCLLVFMFCSIFFAYQLLTDHEPPELFEAKFEAPDRITLTFNEPVSLQSFTQGALHITGGMVLQDPVTGKNSQTINIAVDPPVKDQYKGELTIQGVQDLAGNAISGLLRKPISYDDIYPPSVVKCAEEDGYIKITFNETIKVNPNGARIRLTSLNGDRKSVAPVELIYSDEELNTIRTQNQVQMLAIGQDYNLTFEGISDTATPPNIPATIRYKHRDQTAPKLLQAKYQTNGIELILNFNEPVRLKTISPDGFKLSNPNIHIYEVHLLNTENGISLLTDYTSIKDQAGKDLWVTFPKTLSDANGNLFDSTQQIPINLPSYSRCAGKIKLSQGSFSKNEFSTTLEITIQDSTNLKPYPPLKATELCITYASRSLTGPESKLFIPLGNTVAKPHVKNIPGSSNDLKVKIFNNVQISILNDAEPDKITYRIQFPSKITDKQLDWKNIEIFTQSHGKAELNPTRNNTIIKTIPTK